MARRLPKLQEFKKEFGHVSPIAKYKTLDDYTLGNWVVTQRVRKDVLTPERKTLLDDLGFIWEPFEYQWQEGYQKLQEFKKEFGHVSPTQTYKTTDGFTLGVWVSKQRKKALSLERKKLLDDLDFNWSGIDTLRENEFEKWQVGFQKLQEYIKEFKNITTPLRYKSPDGYALGNWVNTQRIRKDSMAPERKALLDGLGFIWKIR